MAVWPGVAWLLSHPNCGEADDTPIDRLGPCRSLAAVAIQALRPARLVIGRHGAPSAVSDVLTATIDRVLHTTDHHRSSADHCGGMPITATTPGMPKLST